MVEFPLIIFDGNCGFCNGTVKWIITNERNERLRFTPRDSGFARSVMAACDLDPDDSDSIVFVESGYYYLESDAVVEVAKFLKRPWSLLGCIKHVPKPVRDWCYRRVAANRMKLGKSNKACDLSGEAIRGRIIDS